MAVSKIDIPQQEEPGFIVHKCPAIGRKEIHYSYGLWIISSRREQKLVPVNIHKKRYFEFYVISQLLEGEAFYLTPEGERYTYKPGQGVIMVPNFFHFYGSGKNYYVEDTIRFTGPIADHLYQSGIIAPGVIDIGRHRRLVSIAELADNPSNQSQIRANIALQNLLVDLYFENMQKKQESHSTQITELLNAVQANPSKWWTMSELAQLCDLSINQFRNVFKRETGMTPKYCIDKMKMTRAAELLTSTNKSIAKIAQMHGYSDHFHFSRRFKQVMGCSPDFYRKNH